MTHTRTIGSEKSTPAVVATQSPRPFGAVAAIVLVSLGAIGVSLFRHWEPSGESWGYWYFARVFAETGRFIIPDRSPLYTLYLTGFRWLGYPTSVAVEFVVSSVLTLLALVFLLRPNLGWRLACFAALLWVPFWQVGEPPVQKFALACSCMAIGIRRGNPTRFRVVLSYAWFGLAAMFRNTYSLFIPMFLAWDTWRVLRGGGLKMLVATLHPRRSDWPVGAVMGLGLWFMLMQSPHPWNNAWITSTTYFPNNGKRIIDASFIQGYNWKYIEATYGSFRGKDFYFTNQEVFGGATSLVGAVRSNPGMVMRQLSRNLKDLVYTASSVTGLFRLYSGLSWPQAVTRVVVIILLALVAYGAFRASTDPSIALFLIGNLLIVGTSVLVLPKTRYMLPLIPLLALSAWWYGARFREVLAMRRRGTRSRGRLWLASGGKLAIPVALVLLSPGVQDWPALTRAIVHDARHGQLRAMNSRPYSMHASFAALEPLVRSCRGVLALESTFVGGFMHVPVQNVYDVWEIPPFGRFGQTAYTGLRPDRIDCVLVSHELATGVGMATNYQIRYENHVKPYVDQLNQMGAATHNIAGFGQAIILPRRG